MRSICIICRACGSCSRGKTKDDDLGRSAGTCKNNKFSLQRLRETKNGGPNTSPPTCADPYFSFFAPGPCDPWLSCFLDGLAGHIQEQSIPSTFSGWACGAHPRTEHAFRVFWMGLRHPSKNRAPLPSFSDGLAGYLCPHLFPTWASVSVKM